MSNIETPQVYIYNSLTSKKELFVPYKHPNVGFYTCGITVYHDTTIGHIKKYVGDDLIRRGLEFLGYNVRHVQNVTDVGHLTSDADDGEDKMEKGAKIHNMDVWKLAETLTEDFYTQMDLLNVLRPTVIQRATNDTAIKEQIKMIEKIIEGGYGYVADKAIYFDVSKLPNYNPFSKQSLSDKIKGFREEVVTDAEKRNSADFVLWFFTKGAHQNHVMRWESPWGTGFPGWHIECSAISTFNLGENIDIHTGGVDHIEIHHPNEIAQNYACYGHDVVKYWVHHKFLLVDGKKMSKSVGNYYVLNDLINKGFNTLDIRYFMLQAHYRSELNFTLSAVESAKKAYLKLVTLLSNYLQSVDGVVNAIDKTNTYYKLFVEAISDDFNIPRALAVMWDLVNDTNIEENTKLNLVFEFDKVFGLKLEEKSNYTYLQNKKSKNEIPDNIKQLAIDRFKAKQEKNYALADELRGTIEKLGYRVVDLATGYTVEYYRGAD